MFKYFYSYEASNGTKNLLKLVLIEKNLHIFSYIKRVSERQIAKKSLMEKKFSCSFNQMRKNYRCMVYVGLIERSAKHTSIHQK